MTDPRDARIANLEADNQSLRELLVEVDAIRSTTMAGMLQAQEALRASIKGEAR